MSRREAEPLAVHDGQSPTGSYRRALSGIRRGGDLGLATCKRFAETQAGIDGSDRQ